MSTYAIGSVVRLTTEVRNTSGTLVTPAAVTVTIQLPDATTAGPFTPTNDGTGLYHYDYTPVQSGRHIARWVTTTPTAADEEPFEVAVQWAEAGILSLSEAKAQLDITGTDDDEEIQGFIRAMTDPIERMVGPIVRRTVVEKHDGGYRIALHQAPVLSLTSVEAIRAGGTDQAVADLDVDGPTGIVERLDGGYMCGPLRWTYVVGRTDVQPHVRLAALLILQHMWETQRGHMGGVSFGGSGEVYDPRFGFSIPRRAQELLGDQPPRVA